MKAAFYRKLGSVLECVETPKPAAIDDRVLIKVRAASVNAPDWRLKMGRPPGSDVAGEVEAVGRTVTRFRPGDSVFGVCRGAFAEYATARQSALVFKPDNVAFEQAACAPVAGLTALQGLRDKGRVRAGQTVLVNGASGGVGTFAVQIANWFGGHVTGVCSTRNVDMVRSIGAERVIDYTQENFTEASERYDVLFDCVGNHSLSACRQVLNRDGICVIAGAPKKMAAIAARTLKALVLSRIAGAPFALFVAKMKNDDLQMLSDLLAAGKVTAVIDRSYPLTDVANAVRYVEQGHARGKVVITVG